MKMNKKILLIAIAVFLSVSVPARAITIQLQTANTQNLADTWINSSSVNQNYGANITMYVQGTSGSEKYALLKFNISDIPAMGGITDSQLCLYLSTTANNYYVNAHYLFINYTCGGVLWNESCPTWALRPNASLGQYDMIPMSYVNFTTSSSTGWYCWNVTNSIIDSYSKGFKNTSFYMIANASVGSPTTTLQFRSKETPTASTRPYLNITYFDISLLNLSAVYSSEINTTGNYSILANYTYNGTKVGNATLNICYTFTSPQCYNMVEGSNYYYWNFSYDHDMGGIIQFNITAYSPPYPNLETTFFITFFDSINNVRFWQDLNMSEPYINEFLWVYAKPHCDFYQQYYLGLYEICNTTAYRSRYVGGVATVNIWSPNTYDLYVVDGAVFWNCSTCEPVATGYSIWGKFDTITIESSGSITRDYFWNTTLEGQYPLFGNPDWNFWTSIVGIVILICVSSFVALYSDNGLASIFVILLCYILLKLFHILTGSIFFGLF